MTSLRSRDGTPDAHLFPTRRYDLVREFVIALGVVLALSLMLAAVFSSPDRKSITLRDWAQAAPNDVVATATAELAGTSGSAGYGAPYNHASTGQQLGPLRLQQWGGVRVPVDSANDLVLTPLRQVTGDAALTRALAQWSGAAETVRTTWASTYADALGKVPDGNPSAVKGGSYGPVPLLAQRFLALAKSGGLESMLAGGAAMYPSNSTKSLLLLSDGAYLEDQARAENLGGDQWGMMNEVGNYPGQPWMWLYTFWYQVRPFSTSDNADALVWGLMMVLSAGLLLVPLIPGVRSLPRVLRLHRFIWR